jgi:hypothetical protein
MTRLSDVKLLFTFRFTDFARRKERRLFELLDERVHPPNPPHRGGKLGFVTLDEIVKFADRPDVDDVLRQNDLLEFRARLHDLTGSLLTLFHVPLPPPPLTVSSTSPTPGT